MPNYHYLLSAFVAQAGFPEGVLGFVVSGIALIVGIVTLLVPAKLMLKWDRRTGYGVYQRVLRETGDEKLALAGATIFYRAFGACFIVVGLSGLFVATWTALSN